MTLGILGGGQLARMMCQAANRIGIRTIVWSGGGDISPVRYTADEVLSATFDDAAAKAEFLKKADAITVETEKIAEPLLQELKATGHFNPRPMAVRIAGDRKLEREFIAGCGIDQTPFRIANTEEELKAAFAQFDGNCVAKTTRDGYDGKGQWRLKSDSDVSTCWAQSAGYELVVEKFIPFQGELSVIVARSADGQIEVYDPAENLHRHHILDISIVPARFDASISQNAREIAKKIVTELEYVGLMAIELFIEQDGNLLINELAPRPHNSGHHTLDACVTSQFEQHVRAVCSLPLGSTRLKTPVVMLNLLSDIWRNDHDAFTVPEIAAYKNANWHFYEKQWKEGRRKLSHVNFTAPSIEQAVKEAESMKALLTKLNSESATAE